MKPILTMKWFNRRSSGRARVLARREQVCIAAEAKRSTWDPLASANHPAAAGRGRDPSRL